MQDHEKWIKDSFSDERVPLDTHALFQELQSELPQNKRKHRVLWISLLLLLLLCGGAYYMLDSSIHLEETVTSQLSDEQQLVHRDDLGTSLGSSPKKEDQLSTDPEKKNNVYDSSEDFSSSLFIENSKSMGISEADKLKYNESSRTSALIDNSRDKLANQTSKNEAINFDSQRTSGSIKIDPNLDVTKTETIDESQNHLGEFSNNSHLQIPSVTTDENFRNSYDNTRRSDEIPFGTSHLALKVTEPIMLKSYHSTPIVNINTTPSKFISFWAQASISNSSVNYNTGNQTIDQLYQDITQSKPGLQIDLGTSIKLRSHLRLRTSLFYRSLVQSMNHSYAVRSTSEQEGIKQLIVNSNGNSNSDIGSIEVVEVRLYQGIWYQFLNQTGLNITMAYSKILTPRSVIEAGLGVSSSLFSQNKGSFISEELTINSIENNSYTWNPVLSFQPTLGYSYTINQKLKAGIQLQYFNTQTLFSNQQLRYNVFNIGLNCSYKL